MEQSLYKIIFFFSSAKKIFQPFENLTSTLFLFFNNLFLGTPTQSVMEEKTSKCWLPPTHEIVLSILKRAHDEE